MFLKSTKQAYSKLLQTRQSLGVTARMTSSLTNSASMLQYNQMAFRSNNRQAMNIMGNVPQRAFSLPDHIVMEMPNLSPTMEKVSSLSLNAFVRFEPQLTFLVLSTRVTSSNGTSRSATRSPSVMPSLRLRPIRQWSTLKCRKKVTLLSYSSRRVRRMYPSDKPLRSLSRTRRTLQPSLTMMDQVALSQLPLPLQRLLLHPLRPLPLRQHRQQPTGPIILPSRCPTCHPPWRR